MKDPNVFKCSVCGKGVEVTLGDFIVEPCSFCLSTETKTPIGWQCPVCKRGLSPYVTECPCYVKEVVFIPMTSGSQQGGGE